MQVREKTKVMSGITLYPQDFRMLYKWPNVIHCPQGEPLLMKAKITLRGIIRNCKIYPQHIQHRTWNLSFYYISQRVKPKPQIWKFHDINDWPNKN